MTRGSDPVGGGMLRDPPLDVGPLGVDAPFLVVAVGDAGFNLWLRFYDAMGAVGKEMRSWFRVVYVNTSENVNDILHGRPQLGKPTLPFGKFLNVAAGGNRVDVVERETPEERRSGSESDGIAGIAAQGGAEHRYERGLEIVAEHEESLEQRILDAAAQGDGQWRWDGLQWVMVFFSTGGGTGSAGGPIIGEILKRIRKNQGNPAMRIQAVTILPGQREPAIMHANAQKSWAKVVEGPDFIFDSIIAVDNCQAGPDRDMRKLDRSAMMSLATLIAGARSQHLHGWGPATDWSVVETGLRRPFPWATEPLETTDEARLVGAIGRKTFRLRGLSRKHPPRTAIDEIWPSLTLPVRPLDAIIADAGEGSPLRDMSCSMIATASHRDGGGFRQWAAGVHECLQEKITQTYWPNSPDLYYKRSYGGSWIPWSSATVSLCVGIPSSSVTAHIQQTQQIHLAAFDG